VWPRHLHLLCLLAAEDLLLLLCWLFVVSVVPAEQ
jgi:hypothetical protein